MSMKWKHRCLPQFDCLEDRLAPATMTVTTRADVVKPGDGKISLREAITKANATKAPDTIVLGAGVYKIAVAGAGEDANASGDFDVTRSLTIMGQGAKKTFVDGAQLDRLFDIRGPFKVTFADLTLRHGATADSGGAIQVTEANLQLTHCGVSDNTARAGGGISNPSGSVTMTGCTVTRNVAQDGFGGGINVGGDGTVMLTKSTVSGNAADLGGGINGGTVRLIKTIVRGNSAQDLDGGGVFAFTSATLIKSTVSANTAKRDGGGIFANTTVTLMKSTVLGNFARLAGGIFAGAAATLIKSNVVGNRSDADFGGIFAVTTVTLTKSGVSNNVAGGGDGGIAAGDAVFLIESAVSGNSAVSGAGGIEANASVTLIKSTVSGNSTGSSAGGIFANTVTVTNSTVIGNAASFDGGGIKASVATLSQSTITGNSAGRSGGGIFASSQATLINSTVSGNSAAEGGGIFADKANLLHATITRNSAHTGGGVFQQSSGPFTLKNTIIAQNQVDAGGARPDVFGNFTSLGHNLIGIKDGGAGFSSATDLLGTAASPLDPKLGPLQNNGGATKTHALLKGSPAIDAGVNDPLARLTAPIAAKDTMFLVDAARLFAPGMRVRLEREVVRVLSVTEIKKRLIVQRAGPKQRAAHSVGTGLLLATDQRGVARPRDGDDNGSRRVDIGAFER